MSRVSAFVLAENQCHLGIRQTMLAADWSRRSSKETDPNVQIDCSIMAQTSLSRLGSTKKMRGVVDKIQKSNCRSSLFVYGFFTTDNRAILDFLASHLNACIRTTGNSARVDEGYMHAACKDVLIHAYCAVRAVLVSRLRQ